MNIYIDKTGTMARSTSSPGLGWRRIPNVFVISGNMPEFNEWLKRKRERPGTVLKGAVAIRNIEDLDWFTLEKEDEFVVCGSWADREDLKEISDKIKTVRIGRAA